ncbi:unnamed protein product [Enterobius vermicularis]|uniref:Cys_knot domain-containing protein n=1 Tax=Enterobius vermicularis TaxID=51028 RepID=A0A0N4VDG9_ENTVE|nr:unnamed protein product [Enterobius vermicularis]
MYACLITLFAVSECKNNPCSLHMMPLPGTNPYVRTDQNGHSCRSHIKIAVCKGYCLSQEFGTHEFPHRKQNSNVCVQEGGFLETVEMDECDPEADQSIRTYRVLRNSTCTCKKCDSASMMCLKNSLID